MYTRILVPIDGSATAERGLREAFSLASAQKQPAALQLLHVLADFSLMVEMASTYSFDATMQKLREQGQQLLDEARRRAGECGLHCQTALREIRQGRVADAIVAEAEKAGCDLIVMGTHGRRGFSRWTLGSEADQVVRSASVPLLLVRQPD